MITRRYFQSFGLFLGFSFFSPLARAQDGGSVMVRIRVDETARTIIPPIVQSKLSIKRDDSEEARALADRSPPDRAVPIILIIIGAIAIPLLIELVREALRQVYYGGVVIDLRANPATITNDPKIPGSMVFVIDTEGKTTRYTSDQVSPELLESLLKHK